MKISLRTPASLRIVLALAGFCSLVTQVAAQATPTSSLLNCAQLFALPHDGLPLQRIGEIVRGQAQLDLAPGESQPDEVVQREAELRSWIDATQKLVPAINANLAEWEGQMWANTRTLGDKRLPREVRDDARMRNFDVFDGMRQEMLKRIAANQRLAPFIANLLRSRGVAVRMATQEGFPVAHIVPGTQSAENLLAAWMKKLHRPYELFFFPDALFLDYQGVHRYQPLGLGLAPAVAYSRRITGNWVAVHEIFHLVVRVAVSAGLVDASWTSTSRVTPLGEFELPEARGAKYSQHLAFDEIGAHALNLMQFLLEIRTTGLLDVPWAIRLDLAEGVVATQSAIMSLVQKSLREFPERAKVTMASDGVTVQVEVTPEMSGNKKHSFDWSVEFAPGTVRTSRAALQLAEGRIAIARERLERYTQFIRDVRALPADLATSSSAQLDHVIATGRALPTPVPWEYLLNFLD